MSFSSPPPTGLTLSDTTATLRAMPFGGLDDGARSLLLPTKVQAAVSPTVIAVRWGASMLAMVFVAPRATAGDLGAVKALALVLFLTCWRSIRPIQLGSHLPAPQLAAFSDSIILGAIVGLTGALESPFVYALLAALAVTSFGWGLRRGVIDLAVAGTVAFLIALGGHHSWSTHTKAGIAAQVLFVTTVVGVGFFRDRLLDIESRRLTSLDVLADTSDLLRLLNQLARSAPTSFDLRGALETAQEQFVLKFNPQVMVLLVSANRATEWTPHITVGCALEPSLQTDQLHERLRAAALGKEPIIYPTLTAGVPGMSQNSRSGIYVAIQARGKMIGLLGIEHPQAGRYSTRDRHAVAAMCDIIGLTIDNARSFDKLKKVGADEERTRMARDLHDRVGQWLTVIRMQVERIIRREPESSPELMALQSATQEAIDELRETLRQMRAKVTAERRFDTVANELIIGLADRAKLDISLLVANPGAHVSEPVENELLRILQEALSNVLKHAQATQVRVHWNVVDDKAVLEISDNGRGFVIDRSVRDNSYGLIGMRERAESIDAQIEVSSTPGAGTTIRAIYEQAA